MAMRIITVAEFECERCGWKWMPRSEEKPRSCPNPKCRSIYWDKPRKNKQKSEDKKE